MNASDLIRSLSDGSETDRRAAARELASQGEGAQPAAIALVESLAVDDDELREWCVAALEDLGTPRVDDRDALIGLVRHDNAHVAYWACTLLGRLGNGALEAAPTLADVMLTSSAPEVCQRAAWALGKIKSSDPQVVQKLADAAKSDDVRLARLASQAITVDS